MPRSMFEGFDRHGLTVVQAWGMTETAPLGLGVPAARRASTRAMPTSSTATARRQGVASPFFEIRARDDEGQFIAWDDAAMGELEVRGPWVAASYHARPRRRQLHRRRLVQDRRRGPHRRARLHPDLRPLKGSREVRRRVDLLGRPGEPADVLIPPSRRPPSSPYPTTVGASARSRWCRCAPALRPRRTSCVSTSRRSSPSGNCRTASSSWRRSPARPPASSRRPSCATNSRQRDTTNRNKDQPEGTENEPLRHHQDQHRRASD